MKATAPQVSDMTLERANKRSWISISPGILLASPSMLLVIVCLVAPLVTLFTYSFYRFIRAGKFEEILTLTNYVSVLTDSFYLSVIANTFILGLIVTGISVMLAYPVSIAIARTRGMLSSVILALVVLPLMTSGVVRTFGWVVVLGRNGFVNESLIALGFIDNPIRFLFDRTGVIIGIVHLFLPIMILVVASGLRNVDISLEESARNLGAGPIRTFVRVTLPLSLPGVMAGSFLVFALSISAFITPAILGGGKVQMIAMIIFDTAAVALNWPMGAALAATLLAFTLVLITVSFQLGRRASRWREEEG